MPHGISNSNLIVVSTIWLCLHVATCCALHGLYEIGSYLSRPCPDNAFLSKFDLHFCNTMKFFLKKRHQHDRKSKDQLLKLFKKMTERHGGNCLHEALGLKQMTVVM